MIQLKSAQSGMALIFVIVVLSVLLVLAFALSDRGTINLSQVFHTQKSTEAYYAAQAGVALALYSIKNNDVNIPTGCGQTAAPTSLQGQSIPQILSNNTQFTLTITNNYGSTCTTNQPAPDGTQIPPNMIYAASQGAIASTTKVSNIIVSIAGIGDYSALTNYTIDITGDTDGPVRNNQTSGSPSITVGGTGISATTPDSPGSIVGNIPTKLYNQPQVMIPNIPVATISQNCGTVSGGCSSCTNVTGLSGMQLVGPNCYYSTSDWTMNGNSGGGYTMTGGAKLYVFGDLRVNGGPHLDLSGGEGTPPSSTTAANNNLIVVAGSVSVHGNTSNHDWNTSLLVGGSTGNPGITFSGPTPPNFVGFFYAQNGNMSIPGDLAGSVIMRGGAPTDGTLSVAGTVTTNISYLNQYLSYFSSTPRILTTTSQWNQ